MQKLMDFLFDHTAISKSVCVVTSILTFIITDLETVNIIARTITALIGMLIAVLTAIPITIKTYRQVKTWWKDGVI